jgi:hypothetical protein
MTTLDQVRLGLETRLGTIAGVKTWGMVPDALDPPAIIVPPPTVDSYFGDLDTGSFEARFEIAVLVSTTTDTNQLQLLPFLERSGARSIFATVMADTTLGGLNVEAKPVSSRPLGKTQIGDISYFGAAVTINVIIGE